MIERLIEGCARRPFVTLLATLALGGWGWLALGETPLDAIPDISDTQVIVYSEWPGRSADLVERQVTERLSASLLATARVRSVRGQSFFGSSFVWVIFEDGTDPYWARTRVFENLQKAAPRLPPDVRPVLGPDATGVGWVFQYALVDRSGRTPLDALRALQDFRLRPALESVPGVAEVASIGGFVRAWQVVLDPRRMEARAVSLKDVEMAVAAANQDVGGEALEVAEHEQVVVGRGLLTSAAELGSVVVRSGADGDVVRLGDLGAIEVVPAPRRGIAELDGEGEVVGGIIVMRDGENALSVIARVKERLAELGGLLPVGTRLEITYDRSELIEAAVGTLKRALLEEMIVVSLVILVFLLHVRSALVPILTLPVAVLAAFIPMAGTGLTTNIMSLGGIVIAIGDMVDGAIVVIENVHKRLEDWDAAGNPVPEGATAREARRRVIIDAMKEVGPSIFGSLLVLTVAFLPIVTLASTEGRLFRPLAATKTFAMGFAAILAVTATPALVALLVKGRILPEKKHVLTRLIVAAYIPVVRFVVRHRWLVVGLAATMVALTVPAFLRLQPEFMPPLEEHDLLYMPTSPAGMPDAVAARTLQVMDRVIKEVPEVERVFGKAGRADTATDPAPLSMFETVVKLKPRSEWAPGRTLADVRDDLDARLTVPGMPNIWWMPVQTRLEMLATGLRSNLGVKVFGPDPATIERAAIQIEQALGAVPGTRAVTAERDASSFYLELQIDREAAARHGIAVAEIGRAIEVAIAGMPLGEALPRGEDARQRWSITARYAREWRDDPSELGRVLVAAGGMAGADGRQVPLGTLARLVPTTAPMAIRSEAGQVVGYVLVDVDERVRSVPDYVAAAQPVLAGLTLPGGVRYAFAGQFESWERASERLVLVGLATLLLVIGLLYWNTRSAVETGIVLLAVPFSLIGAVWLVWALDYHLSVAVWVGLIALAGLDAETGVVMLLYLTLSHRRRAEAGQLNTNADLLDAIVDGAARRIRPKLMTILVNIVGLAPVLASDGTGADVMKRVAVPLFGGVITSFLLELTVYPALFAIWKGYRSRERRPAP